MAQKVELSFKKRKRTENTLLFLCSLSIGFCLLNTRELGRHPLWLSNCTDHTDGLHRSNCTDLSPSYDVTWPRSQPDNHIHHFIQQIFIESLVRAKYCLSTNYSEKQNSPGHCPSGVQWLQGPLGCVPPLMVHSYAWDQASPWQGLHLLEAKGKKNTESVGFHEARCTQL